MNRDLTEFGIKVIYSFKFNSMNPELLLILDDLRQWD